MGWAQKYRPQGGLWSPLPRMQGRHLTTVPLGSSGQPGMAGGSSVPHMEWAQSQARESGSQGSLGVLQIQALRIGRAAFARGRAIFQLAGCAGTGQARVDQRSHPRPQAPVPCR